MLRKTAKTPSDSPGWCFVCSRSAQPSAHSNRSVCSMFQNFGRSVSSSRSVAPGNQHLLFLPADAPFLTCRGIAPRVRDPRGLGCCHGASCPRGASVPWCLSALNSSSSPDDATGRTGRRSPCGPPGRWTPALRSLFGCRDWRCCERSGPSFRADVCRGDSRSPSGLLAGGDDQNNKGRFLR